MDSGVQKMVLGLVGKETFVASLLYAISKRGLELNLLRLTNEQVGRLANYVGRCEPRWKVGDLFTRASNGRYQKFVDTVICLCHGAPLINNGVAKFEDLACDAKFSDVGKLIERHEKLLEFFDRCATMLLVEPPSIPKRRWWQRLLGL